MLRTSITVQQKHWDKVKAGLFFSCFMHIYLRAADAGKETLTLRGNFVYHQPIMFFFFPVPSDRTKPPSQHMLLKSPLQHLQRPTQAHDRDV